MNVEILCPSCGNGYWVDDSAAVSGLPCPGCAAPIPPGIPVSDERDIPAGSTDRISPPPDPAPVESDAAATAPVARPTVVRRARTSGEEVVCPRCNLHFFPQGQAESVANADERPTVLVVEDMEYFQEIARDALAASYNVKTAETVAEARELLRAGGVSVLVLDLTLDGGDHGLDLLRGFSTKPCPILIYTAKDESEMYGDSWEELQNLGADDIVIKGMNVGESLVRKVSTLLGLEVED